MKERAIFINDLLEMGYYFFEDIKIWDIETIKKLKKMGAKFSLGSDSHKSEDVGDFGKAYNIAVESGLTDDDIVNADGSAHRSMKLLRD